MAMRSSTSPRRVYSRSGSVVTCYGGVYFGPKAGAESSINVNKEVRIEVLENAFGTKRIQVTQKIGKQTPVVEVWTEKHLTFNKRAAAPAAEPTPAPEG
jgi:hypothetical protein